MNNQERTAQRFSVILSGSKESHVFARDSFLQGNDNVILNLTGNYNFEFKMLNSLPQHKF